MKKLLLIALVLIIKVGSVAANHNPVKILSADGGILYLKFSKSFSGAKVEVKDQNDSTVLSQDVHEHRVMLDFYYFKPGKYVVSISKGEFIETFSYTVEDAGSPKAASTESITHP